MSAATEPGGGKLTAARAAFVGFLGLALGWAGVVVAAVAVAVERAKNGDDVVQDADRVGSGSWWRRHREQAAERRGAASQRARDWLAHDAERRRQLAQQRQQWIKDGGDPAAEPKKPGYLSRLVAGIRRTKHRGDLLNDKLLCRWDDAVAGAREGWRAAAPNAGQGFKAAASSRPSRQGVDGGPPVDAEIIPEARGNREQKPDPWLPEDPLVPTPSKPEPTPAPETPEPAPAPAPAGTGENTEISNGTGDDMAIPTTPDKVKANSNPQAVDGEDQLDRITANLGQMGGTLTASEEFIDQLAAQARTLRSQAAATMERAGDKASVQTRQACDEANALAGQIEAMTRRVSELAAACAESVQQADAGLQVNRQQRDDVQATGADPSRLFARANDA